MTLVVAVVAALSPIDVAAVGMAGSIGRASGVIAEMECCLPMNAAAAIFFDDFYSCKIFIVVKKIKIYHEVISLCTDVAIVE